MALDTTHQEFRGMQDSWRRMRHVLEGQTAMTRAGTDYIRLPVGKKDPTEKQRYIEAAPFVEFTQRTLEGLTGLAFYRRPEMTLPPAMQPFIEDATQDGVPLEQFAESITEEVISVGRVGVLVDFPPKDPAIKTRRDEEAAKRRAFVRKYQTEDIFNWSTGLVRGAVLLTEVRLHEVETEQVGDFASRSRRRIRVLQLREGPPDEQGVRHWTYVQRIFVHREWTNDDGTTEGGAAPAPHAGGTAVSADDWSEQESFTPLLPNGKPLDYIPFWIINPTDQSPKVKRPPLIGLANINIAHFSTSAQLENALFWVGNPQPFIAGIDPETKAVFEVGSDTMWMFADPQTKVDFLSYGSDKLSGLQKRLEEHKQDAAMLGARMLSAEKRQVESAETARIHRQGEMSVLAGIAGSVSRTLTDVCRVACDWSGSPDEKAEFKIHTAFFDQAITPEDALKIVELWQKNAIAPADMITLLKRGEIIHPDRTIEAIVSENQTSIMQPVMPGLTETSGGSDPTLPPSIRGE